MAGWLEQRRICRHNFYLSKRFLEASMLFIAICMNVPTSYAQQQPAGFLSIYCGRGSDFHDSETGLNWVTDVNSTFISTGDASVISNGTDSIRIFPERRNKYCYELPTTANTTYLFRAGFYYDPQLSLPITFDVSINATTVFTIKYGDYTQSDRGVNSEVIFFSPGNVVYVCLRPVDGVAFIQSLELRPLDSLMYSYSGSQTQYLVSLERWNIGASSNAAKVRYPDDKYDRFWYSPSSDWQDRVNASAPPDNTSRPEVNSVPPKVMQDAWAPADPSILWYIMWPNIFQTSSGPVIVNPGEYAYVAVYAEELVNNSKGGEMSIVLDEYPVQKVEVSGQARMLANTNFILSANGIKFEISSQDVYGISVNAVEFYGQFNFNFSTTDQTDSKPELRPPSKNLNPFITGGRFLFGPSVAKLAGDRYSYLNFSFAYTCQGLTHNCRRASYSYADYAVTALKERFSLLDWQGDPCTPVPHDWLSCEVNSALGQGSQGQICQTTDHCSAEPSFLRSTYSVIALNLSNLPASGFGLLQEDVAEASYTLALQSLTQMSITESGVNGSIFQFLINEFCLNGSLTFLDFTSNSIESLPIGDDWGASVDGLAYLNMSKNSITGNLRPFDEAPFFNRLQVLNLSYNAITSINNTWKNGPTTLVALDLSHNKLTGDISSLDTLVQLNAGTLQELYISNNSLTGTISPLYFSLPNLTIANFDGNSIYGALNLSAWHAALQQDVTTNSSTPGTQKLFSFVDNSISSIVPSAEALDSTITSLLNTHPNFGRNGILLGGNPYCKDVKSKTKQYLCRSKVDDRIIPLHDSNDAAMIIGICVGLGGVLVACATAATTWRSWKQAKKQVHALQEIQRALKGRKVQPPFFEYTDLRLATRGFHKDNRLGQGGFGEVYRGVLPDNTNLAVKMLFSSGQAVDEFLNEMVLITGIKHRNLVQLKGCCINNEERILVYEYAEKGNLAEALWGCKAHGGLNWKQRLNICVGVARGLSYLHEELQPSIIHRDIKPENILLDVNLQPKIADFGLARHFRGDTNEAMYTTIAGTLGYFSPEYATQGQLCEKADVYSYGIVVLETISGRKCIDYSQPIDRVYLKDWVLGLNKSGLLLDVLQPELRDSCKASEVLQSINIGLQCVHQDPASRPSMSEVVTMFLGHTRNDHIEITLEESANGHPSMEDLLGATNQQVEFPSPSPLIGPESDEITFMPLGFEASSSDSSSISRKTSSKTMIQLSRVVGR